MNNSTSNVAPATPLSPAGLILKAPTPRFTLRPPIREELLLPPVEAPEEPHWQDFSPRWWPGQALDDE